MRCRSLCGLQCGMPMCSIIGLPGAGGWNAWRAFYFGRMAIAVDVPADHLHEQEQGWEKKAKDRGAWGSRAVDTPCFLSTEYLHGASPLHAYLSGFLCRGVLTAVDSVYFRSSLHYGDISVLHRKCPFFPFRETSLTPLYPETEEKADLGWLLFPDVHIASYQTKRGRSTTFRTDRPNSRCIPI